MMRWMVAIILGISVSYAGAGTYVVRETWQHATEAKTTGEPVGTFGAGVPPTTITFSAGHGYINGDVLECYWGTGSRAYGCTLSGAAGNTFTISAGTGDAFVAANVATTALVKLPTGIYDASHAGQLYLATTADPADSIRVYNNNTLLLAAGGTTQESYGRAYASGALADRVMATGQYALIRVHYQPTLAPKWYFGSSVSGYPIFQGFGTGTATNVGLISQTWAAGVGGDPASIGARPCWSGYYPVDSNTGNLATDDEETILVCCYVRDVTAKDGSNNYVTWEYWMQGNWTPRCQPGGSNWLPIGCRRIAHANTTEWYPTFGTYSHTDSIHRPLRISLFEFGENVTASDGYGDLFDPARSSQWRPGPVDTPDAYKISAQLIKTSYGIRIIHGYTREGYDTSGYVYFYKYDDSTRYLKLTNAAAVRTVNSGVTDYESASGVGVGSRALAFFTKKTVAGPDYNVCASYSDDDGVTWSADVVAYASGTTEVQTLTNALVLSTGRILVPIQRSGALLIAYSDDKGATWSSTNTTLAGTEPGLAEANGKLFVIMRNGLGTYGFSWCHSLTAYAIANWGTYAAAGSGLQYADGGSGRPLWTQCAAGDTPGCWSRVVGNLTRLYLLREASHPSYGYAWRSAVERCRRNEITLDYSDDYGQTWTSYKESPLSRQNSVSFQYSSFLNDGNNKLFLIGTRYGCGVWVDKPMDPSVTTVTGKQPFFNMSKAKVTTVYK